MDACWDVWDIISCWEQPTFWVLKQGWGLLKSPAVFSQGQQAIFTVGLVVLEVWWFTYQYSQVMNFSFVLIVSIRLLVFVREAFSFTECVTV